MVDFGSWDAGFITTNGNSMAMPGFGQTHTDLVDANGASTGINLLVTDSFYPWWNTSGTTASTIFPASASRDGFYVTATDFGAGAPDPTGGFELQNLDPAYTYDVLLYGSRAGVSDVRESQYTVTGAGIQVLLLNASGNVDNYVVATGVVPDANGKITIDVAAGPNNNHSAQLAYINLVTLTAVPEPASVTLLALGATALLRRRRV
ncbi:MAG: PEP-CTERM sorting domain-containing protein [Phycisphaeraceae bacterium]|nr:PEP-CTERM sorting domain-containing protein [Phycisphaeraceae bacterium]